MKIVDTDNFGGDYPNEKEVATNITNEMLAKVLVNALNAWAGDDAPRYYKLVPDDYKLVPEFKP